MDTAQHYNVSGLVYHPQPPLAPLPPHPISDSLHHHSPSFSPEMSWRPSHPSPSHSQSAQQGHTQLQPLMDHPQDHLSEYAPSSSAQQPFISRHAPDAFPNHPSSSSLDPGPSSHPLSFDSPQIDSSIGPDRGLTRRRIAMHERVPRDLSQMVAFNHALTHPQDLSHYPLPQQGSRPQTPQQSVYQLPDHTPGHPPMSTPDAYQSISRAPEWRGYFPPAQSRSASGSAASASSNPRSASPALSVASALTSVSSASAPNSHMGGFTTGEGGLSVASLPRKEPTKKKRLWNNDRYDICRYADDHPGLKQEDIAARFGVERSTVSKILKQKHRWLDIDPQETYHVAKLRPSKFPSLERRLEEWVKLASKAGKTLTDSVLRQKARELGDEMGYTADKFKASSGWLENFKHRHGIRRGVWHGSGSLDAKYRAYGMMGSGAPSAGSMIPPAAYTIHQPSPTPMEAPPHGDQEMGLESEEEEAPSGEMSISGQVMHTSVSLQQAWPQQAEEPHGEPSTAPEPAYYSPEQHQGLEFPEHPPPPPVEPETSELPASMPTAEPIAVPLNGDEPGGEQVFIMPNMPEVLQEVTAPTLEQAEVALDQVLMYIRANEGSEDALLSNEDLNFLMQIKRKVFNKMTGRKYDVPFANARTRGAVS